VKSIIEVHGDAGTVSFVEITIESEKGGKEVVQAKTLLVAAGAWTTELLPSYAECLTVTRQLQAWVDTSSTIDPSLYTSSTMPATAIVLNDSPTPLVYTLPADVKGSDQDDAYSNCVKMGIHCRNYPIDPNVNHSTSVTPEEEDEMRTAIRAGFCVDVSSQPVTEIRACMYTMTKDEHFVIGPPKNHQRICAVAGLSGHGFKMAPALGQMLSDFASGKGLDSWNADFCSPSRFGALNIFNVVVVVLGTNSSQRERSAIKMPLMVVVASKRAQYMS
jgi:glycine/D-amino acid oxidase-like deaminating enzyme